MYISVVIPVYRSQKTLEKLYDKLVVVLSEVCDNFEIIFVEDNGGDNSWKIINEIASKDSRVSGIKFSKNFGQHAATLCGISKSSGKWVITIDDDLEQDPEDIKLLIKESDSYDLIYGILEERTHSFWRNFTSEMARKVFKLAIPNLNYNYTSFRMIDGELARSLAKFESPYPFVDGYLSWLTNNYTTVKLKHGFRVDGKSNYSIIKLIKHTINIFTTFSIIPLRISIWIGLLTSILGITGLIYVIISRLFSWVTLSGYASIMATILFFGGVQMFTLGVIGEYLGRINYKTSGKPLFLIGDSTGDSHSGK
ncbi:glycosyltransferase family 2 protein [Paenibacillus sedimenti]|uniref:Glycosyltransferase family 2 protein n=1 Tax=Paenibacillus sedimenti TaxID=2770274 RepID=A0A926KP54_9BACL|nr:glycosyltransferase family 2 protein [Paenibacillus sedimenti]MBD0379694.1 glycosyltransferase family 2 protein [Paenibacillus sedimenti]